MMLGRGTLISVLVPALGLLVACASPPSPITSPAPPSSSTALMTLSPVPLTLSIPAPLAEFAWVAPLTGPDITALGASAAIQVQYRNGTVDEPMIANVLWFTTARYTALMVTADAPKGIKLGLQGDHVLFVQPALDMPFDPVSQDGKNYGALVELVRDFRWYAMSVRSLTLLRPRS